MFGLMCIDEIHCNRGRINVVDLQTILNMDLTHIETKVTSKLFVSEFCIHCLVLEFFE